MGRERRRWPTQCHLNLVVMFVSLLMNLAVDCPTPNMPCVCHMPTSQKTDYNEDIPDM